MNTASIYYSVNFWYYSVWRFFFPARARSYISVPCFSVCFAFNSLCNGQFFFTLWVLCNFSVSRRNMKHSFSTVPQSSMTSLKIMGSRWKTRCGATNVIIDFIKVIYLKYYHISWALPPFFRPSTIEKITAFQRIFETFIFRPS